MIKADELAEFRPTCQYKNGSELSLEDFRIALENEAQKNGIPAAFYNEEVKSGGIFKKAITPCIVLYHPEHKNDYFKFCIQVNYQGLYAFVSVSTFGQSKQLAKAERSEAAFQDRQGKSASYQLGSMISSGIMNIGKSKRKLEEEKMYYSCIADILDTVIC